MFSIIRISSLFFFVFVTSVVFGQKEGNNWYFGNQAGITFNTTPPTALTNGDLSASEGCASISDANGNLLFYTNGIDIWNKNHTIMYNGSGLEGSSLSTQSSLIIKAPGSLTNYYVFTVPDQNQSGAYKYSIVDISLNAGLGKVTLKNQPLLKVSTDPTSIFSDFTEALTAGFHTNQTDIWIVVHQHNTTSFYTYLVTPAGIQDPVISTLGTQTSHLGQCRISPDGKRIALGGYYGSGLDLYDYNATSGVISNARNLLDISSATNRIYGLSFSANSNVLYTTNDNATIRQYDLSNTTTQSIINSRITIASGSGGYYPQMQLGPDRKIYLAQSGQSYLGVIQNPDIIGTGCLFVDNGISLGPKSSNLGLPTFMVNYITQRAHVVDIGKDTTLCPSQELVLNAGNPGATYLWNTRATSQTITVNAPGKFFVDVTIDNVTVSDTILVSYISFAPLSINTTYTYCNTTDPPLLLVPQFTETNYNWEDGTQTLPRIIIASGKYWLERTNGACVTTDTFHIIPNCTTPPTDMIIPNLITPNNDGKNDLFAIKNLPIPDWDLKIYNRWGSLVYNMNGYTNNWGSQNISDGVYYYELNNPTTNVTYKGWLEVLGKIK